jgi:hypothetical protein
MKTMHTSVGTTEAIEGTGDVAYQRPKPWFVTMSLLAAFALFVVCMAVLIYRGVTAADPKSVIVVLGNEKWKSATVTVEGGGLKAPLTASIEYYNKFQVPFFVGRGTFVVCIDRGSFHETQTVELKDDNLLATWQLPPDGPNTLTAR